jgi:metal-responsive CopG/Arc/MetJ family transcriptional regulator
MKSSPKEKTSITLSRQVLKGIDRLAGTKQSRSALIEAVLRRYVRQQERARLHARDLEILNRDAEQFNAEAEDVLGYQTGES